jgi:hypothetical protein
MKEPAGYVTLSVPRTLWGLEFGKPGVRCVSGSSDTVDGGAKSTVVDYFGADFGNDYHARAGQMSGMSRALLKM